ncbi:hypothetical protein SUS17_284 [Sphingomonas sp. S17]|nr:hypothetical protein SUS17_284 [Sphingomonas sp. S17]
MMKASPRQGDGANGPPIASPDVRCNRALATLAPVPRW